MRRSHFKGVKFYDKGVQDVLKSEYLEAEIKNIAGEIASDVNREHPEYNMDDTVFTGENRKRVWVGTRHPGASRSEALDGSIRSNGYKKRR